MTRDRHAFTRTVSSWLFGYGIVTNRHVIALGIARISRSENAEP
jgi:hypothetical protein